MMLCDHATVAEGKLYINGGGWAQTGPVPTPSVIAMLIDVPWDETNMPLSFDLSLHGEDGQPVMQQGPMGPAPIEVDGQFEVGRPAGVAQGTPITVPLAINVQPILLAPGQRFVWELRVGGRTEQDWRLAFSTRQAPPQSSDPTRLPPLN